MDPLPIHGIGGQIGLSPCPGYGLGTRSTPEAKLAEIHAWGASWLVTLMERQELGWLGLDNLDRLCADAGLRWLHAPIADFSAPDMAFELQWARHGPRIHQHLSDGGRIALHCLAGLGRTGTVAARILVEFGYPPAAAVEAVRTARPGSIQSPDQLDYVLNRRWSAPY